MGLISSYLKQPKTDKESSEESNDKLNCGASSMQGWRLSQEDAHNCILDYDANTSFFAVYDGHGGPEVALYTASHYPNFLKNHKLYAGGEFGTALEESFLDFDLTLKSDDVVEELKKLASQGMEVSDDDGESEDEDEENVKHLFEEATMPIEQVIANYANSVLMKSLKLKGEHKEVPEEPKAGSSAATAASSSVACSSSKAASPQSKSSNDVPVSSVDSEEESADSKEAKASTEAEASNQKESKTDAKESIKEKAEDDSAEATSTEVIEPESKAAVQNGETENAISSTTQNGDSPSKKGKGKALKKTKVASNDQKKKVMPQRTTRKLYEQLLDANIDDSDSEEEDEEDETFVGPTEESSDDEGVNHSIENESSSADEDEEEDDDDEEEVEEEYNEYKDSEFDRPCIQEFPGVDSGCTAVVALLKDNTLYVANAGDSRCIVCQEGKAIDMSIDHKPEDKLEKDRILNAGGSVHYDGRIDGGLNLSRAFGDHRYKDKDDLSAREQKVIALPDVKTMTIDPSKDEFMVLACDGIWNFMSSQDVVDFVRPAIKEGKALSKICEEMFEHCLAPNTHNDGTGCDNMTCIIVQFKDSLKSKPKRPLSPDQMDSKRVKTDEEVIPTAGAESSEAAAA